MEWPSPASSGANSSTRNQAFGREVLELLINGVGEPATAPGENQADAVSTLTRNAGERDPHSAGAETAQPLAPAEALDKTGSFRQLLEANKGAGRADAGGPDAGGPDANLADSQSAVAGAQATSVAATDPREPSSDTKRTGNASTQGRLLALRPSVVFADLKRANTASSPMPAAPSSATAAQPEAAGAGLSAQTSVTPAQAPVSPAMITQERPLAAPVQVAKAAAPVPQRQQEQAAETHSVAPDPPAQGASSSDTKNATPLVAASELPGRAELAFAMRLTDTSNQRAQQPNAGNVKGEASVAATPTPQKEAGSASQNAAPVNPAKENRATEPAPEHAEIPKPPAGSGEAATAPNHSIGMPAESRMPAPRPTPAETSQPAATAQLSEASREDPVAGKTVRELSVRIMGDQAQSADLRLIERAGEIRIAVRASDPNLAGALRVELPDLMNRIAHRDVNAELWQPRAASTDNDGTDARRDDRDSNAPPHPQNGRESNQSGGEQARRDQRGAPEWLDGLEEPAAKSGLRKWRRNTK
jgi:hypothetical protein